MKLLTFLVWFPLITSMRDVYMPKWIEQHSDRMLLKFSFGLMNSTRSISLGIDLSLDQTTVEKSIHYNIDSILLSKEALDQFIDSGSIDLKDNITALSPGHFRLNSFKFALISNPKKSEVNYPEGSLALSRSSQSFLYQLYDNQIISRRALSFADWELKLGEDKKEKVLATPLVDHGSK